MENSFYFMRSGSLIPLERPIVGRLILINLFAGSSMVKMRLEAESEVVEVIDSHLVVTG